MAIASIKKSSTPQSELWDLLLSTPEIVNTYTWNSMNPSGCYYDMKCVTSSGVSTILCEGNIDITAVLTKTV